MWLHNDRNVTTLGNTSWWSRVSHTTGNTHLSHQRRVGAGAGAGAQPSPPMNGHRTARTNMWRRQRCAPRKKTRSHWRRVSVCPGIQAAAEPGETSRGEKRKTVPVEDERVCFLMNVAFLSCSPLSVRPDSPPRAEDQASAVLGGASGMRNMEGGLLPERGLVRLVHGTRDRVGGRLAARLCVGPSFNPRMRIVHFSIGGRIFSVIVQLKLEDRSMDLNWCLKNGFLLSTIN